MIEELVGVRKHAFIQIQGSSKFTNITVQIKQVAVLWHCNIIRYSYWIGVFIRFIVFQQIRIDRLAKVIVTFLSISKKKLKPIPAHENNAKV